MKSLCVQPAFYSAGTTGGWGTRCGCKKARNWS